MAALAVAIIYTSSRSVIEFASAKTCLLEIYFRVGICKLNCVSKEKYY